jgi:ParB family chromosome partitioning protein
MAMDFTKSNNANNLRDIQKKAIENSNKIVAIDIPLSEIDKNKDNEKIFNMDDIAFLAQGIKEDGFFGAIEVYKKPDGRYEISAGHRRYEAMKLLGRKTIPCIVKEIPDDFARGKKLLSSNIRNRKLTPMDWARSVAYYEHLLVENGQKKNFEKQATEFFNISSSQLYRYQCLLKLIPELQELADNPLFPFSALREAVSLTPEGQMQFISKKEHPTRITRKLS